jgi:hypothetical protein
MGAVKKKTKLLFEALSHPARMHLIELLAARPRINRELAKRLKITESSLSHHIQLLRDVPGLLVTEREPPGSKCPSTEPRATRTPQKCNPGTPRNSPGLFHSCPRAPCSRELARHSPVARHML